MIELQKKYAGVAALLAAVVIFPLALWLAGCDTAISGMAHENQPPITSLWVRDTSLVENLGGARLTSSVHAFWTGEDPDGYVAFFELRFYPDEERSQVGPEDRWIHTTRNDTIVLLPIPPGEGQANVVFEVRAVDNEGLRDPTPAKTVFPIRNTPPTARISPFDIPPDTTFNVFSIGWTASDPDGDADLDAIEISLNDTLNFVSLSPDIGFITLVGHMDPANPGLSVTDARLHIGRGFQGTDITVPGLRLNDDNTFYVRAVDRAQETSPLQSYSWFVRGPASEILVVNDYRSPNAQTVMRYHLDLLAEYMGTTREAVRERVEIWDLSERTGVRSTKLPPNADPTLRETLTQFQYIYWVTTNTTDNAIRNNFPFAAGVMERFFAQGGKLMMHSPIAFPSDPADAEGNPALLALPMNGLVQLGDTLRPQLRLVRDAPIHPEEPVPGLGEPMPALKSIGLRTNTLPFLLDTAEDVPLLRGSYTYVTQVGARQGPWPGPSTVASISADRRTALFALPLVDDRNGDDFYIGLDGDPTAPKRAVMMLLESLGFPRM